MSHSSHRLPLTAYRSQLTVHHSPTYRSPPPLDVIKVENVRYQELVKQVVSDEKVGRSLYVRSESEL